MDFVSDWSLMETFTIAQGLLDDLLLKTIKAPFSMKYRRAGKILHGRGHLVAKKFVASMSS